MQQPIETTRFRGCFLLPSQEYKIMYVFTYQRSKATKFLHLVPILHFTAYTYTLPRVAPTTPPISYIHHINFSSFESKIKYHFA